MSKTADTKWSISSPIFEADTNITQHRLETSPWAENRNFVYDLVRFLKPKKILELGTHYGCSLFTFAQAIKDNNLEAKLTGIDNWQGDVQAGFYDDSVYNVVRATAEKIFANVDINLIRKNFNEALPEIQPKSIDILHIDGLHTYDAVKEDFESWLPKLNPQGIVLFHDIGEEAKANKYGSYFYWKELRKKYKTLQFRKSWGLGILFPQNVKLYNRLLAENIEDKIRLYTYKSLYLRKRLEVEDMDKLILERYEAIQNQSKMIDDRDKYILSLKHELDITTKELSSKTKDLSDLKIIQNNYQNQLTENQNHNRALASLIEVKDNIMSKQSSQINSLLLSSQKLETNNQELKHIISDYGAKFNAINNRKLIRLLKKLRLFNY